MYVCFRRRLTVAPRPPRPPRRRHRGPLLWILVAGLLSSAGATAQSRRPPKLFEGPLLYGGGSALPRLPPVAHDPWLPTGAQVAATLARPADGAEPPACSFRYPVCVHRGPGVTGDTALAALAAMEQAYERLVVAMDLPAPLPDMGLGGSDALDLYLRAGGDKGFRSEHDLPLPGRFDTASAFCVLDSAARTPLDRAATQCVGEAIAWRLDAGLTPFERRAYATDLWWIVGHPTSLDLQAIDDLQIDPQGGIAGRDLSPLAEGSALFYEFLDTTEGVSGPGRLPTALIAMAAQKTDPRAWEWDNEPDVFDILRHTLGDSPRRMADLLGRLAVDRAFLGARDDGTHLPSMMWAGNFGRVRFAWSFPYSSLPRRVAPEYPLMPTGSAYIWLSLDKVSAKSSLGFRADWEAPVAFKWTLVRVGHDGTELSRMEVKYEESATHAEKEMVNLDGAAGILIVGTNMGGADLSHPFDPDVAPYEPHSFTVYLAAM